MGKFSSKQSVPRVRTPIRTTGERALTYEGNLGYVNDAKGELFRTAVANMVSEDTFYESGQDRDNRFKGLVHQVTSEDPTWVAGFAPFLRDTMQMRSASVVLAAEYVAAGGPNGRKVVTSVLSRADEPAEILAYWRQHYGCQIPAALKRGVADAVQRLYNERSALKYDGQSRAWRMGDVIDVVHPKPKDEWQSDLYRWLLDTRHNREEVTIPDTLPVLRTRRTLEFEPVENRRMWLKQPDSLAAAGYTWESLSGWLQGPMDAAAWEAIIPSMGYMALLRNLRNFDQAGISTKAQKYVIDKLSDPDEVAKSRQFPFRFLSAWQNTGGMTWGWALETALDYSTQNVPEFKGRTLVLVDTSASMSAPISARSSVKNYDIAAVIGATIAKKSDVDLWGYASTWGRIPMKRGDSVLRVAEAVSKAEGRWDHGTNTFQALNATYDGQDRVIIITDMQAHPGKADTGIKCPIYSYDLGGYRVAHLPTEGNRYQFAGFTDAAFRMMALLEAHDHRASKWPWEI
ncbi:MAG: TROVE domain-containing protein [Patescibacteria group bacterium]|nr:TROVE domain-containing protein [Patescibacteria group bacterium]